MIRPSRVAFLASMLLALTLGTSASAACPAGQLVSADTAGQCCWPGQAWSRARKACVGLPSACPAGMQAEDERCVISCPQGQRVTEDTRGHCCWPGQAYSNARQACIGLPTTCPGGLVAQGETCVKACPLGQLVTEDTRGQCCWPGQVYSASRQSCVGVPSACPAGQVADGETCRAASATPVPAPTATPAPAPQPTSGFEPAPYQPGPTAPPPAPTADAPPPPPVVEAPPPGPVAAPQPTPQPQPVGPQQPVRPLSKKERLAAQRAEERARRERADAEAEKTPKRVRAGLIGGFFAGAGFGAGLGLPLRVALFRVMEGETTQGTLALAIEPWLFGAVRPALGVDYLSLGLALNLGVGWEQRLGPIELYPRVGLSNGLNLQAALSNGESVSLYYLLRAFVGLRFAAPAGERSKFLAGLDVHLGGEALWLAYVGIGF